MAVYISILWTNQVSKFQQPIVILDQSHFLFYFRNSLHQPLLLSCAFPIMVSSRNLTRFTRPEVPPSNPSISSRVITQSIIVLGTFAGVRDYEISSISATCSIFWLVVIFLIITWSVIYISADKRLLKFSSAPPKIHIWHLTAAATQPDCLVLMGAISVHFFVYG